MSICNKVNLHINKNGYQIVFLQYKTWIKQHMRRSSHLPLLSAKHSFQYFETPWDDKVPKPFHKGSTLTNTKTHTSPTHPTSSANSASFLNNRSIKTRTITSSIETWRKKMNKNTVKKCKSNELWRNSRNRTRVCLWVHIELFFMFYVFCFSQQRMVRIRGCLNFISSHPRDAVPVASWSGNTRDIDEHKPSIIGVRSFVPPQVRESCRQKRSPP